MAECLLALGANLGDRRRALLGAVSAIAKLPSTVRSLQEQMLRDSFGRGTCGSAKLSECGGANLNAPDSRCAA